MHGLQDACVQPGQSVWSYSDWLLCTQPRAHADDQRNQETGHGKKRHLVDNYKAYPANETLSS